MAGRWGPCVGLAPGLFLDGAGLHTWAGWFEIWEGIGMVCQGLGVSLSDPIHFLI